MAIVLTFHYVCFAWIFFRATTFEGAIAVLDGLAAATVGTVNLGSTVLIALGVGFATHAVPRRLYDHLIETFARLPAAVQALALTSVGLVLHRLAEVDVVPFLYFQF